MAVRTIKVDITGLKDIEKAQKSVSALRDSVLDFEKQLQKLSGKGNSPLSFNVKLEMNTDKALKDFLSLKKQIESLPITNTTKGSVTSDNVGSRNTTNSNAIPNNNGYIRVRDQDYKSWLNLNSAINNVTSSTIGLASQMVKLGAIAPARGLLSVFTSINRSVLDTQKNLMGLVGNGITGALRGGFSTITSSAKTGFDGLVKEAETLGDAMQVYRINMQALGVDDKEVNKSIKRLGDYGKATVFDASDLLEQAGIYSSYGRTDSEQIVKGYAGLLAQTKNPKEGMKTVTEQTSQMLASGVLNQQDYKFIRQRLSALGASRLNAELQKLAESKGESSIIDATRKRKISADEYLDIVNKLGNSDDFQKLVNSIVTPKQAMENLKETLSNLLVYDKIDDEGNSTPGALNRVYVATRDFIKGITDIVGSEKFEGYVKNLGDAIGNTIQSINTFGSAWRLAFGQKFIESISNFAKGFNEGVSGLDVGSTLFKTTKTLFEVLNNSGKSIGEFTKNITTSVFELVDALARVAQAGINGGFLNVISGIVDIYKNIANLAVDSGFVSNYASVLANLTSAINNTIKAVNIETAKSVVNSLYAFVTATISLVEGITTKTTLIDSLASVLQSALGALTEIINSIGEMGAGRANMALENLKNALIGIIDGIKPLLKELAQGAVIALSSNSGKNFFNAVQGFVQAVAGAIKNTLVSLGGSVEGGLRKLLDFLTMAVNFASGIATLLGGVGKYLLIGFIGTKFVAWATNIITSLQTVATAMSSVTGGRINPLKLGGNFSNKALARQGLSSYDIDVAYSGMSRANKNAIPMNLSRSAKAKAGKNMVKGNIALLGADIVTGMINGNVQNSDSASQGTKDFTNVLASTASWASTGALIGSFIPGGTLIGAGIGAVAGFGMGLWDNHKKAEDRKRLEEQATKEAETQSKEEFLQQQAHLREISKQNAQIRNTYFKSITKDTTLVDSVVGANSTIESIKDNSNTTVSGALSQLGIEVAKVPNNVDSLFVKIGDQVKSWKDLKNETGIQDDERLLQSLQLAKSAVGEKFIEFVDENSKAVVSKIATTNPGESHRQSSNLDTFTGQLGQIGVKLQEGKELIFKDISSITDNLKSVIESSSYGTSEEKANALKDVLEKAGFDTTEFMKMSISDRIDKIKQLISQGEILGGSADTQFAKIKEEISTRVADYQGTLGNVLGRIGNTQLDEFNNSLKLAEEIKDEGGEKADIGKILALKDAVTQMINKGYLKAEEASDVFKEAGIEGVDVTIAQDGSVQFKKAVEHLIKAGTKTINNGMTGVQSVDMTTTVTDDLFESAQALAYEVRQYINQQINQLDIAIKQVSQAGDTTKQAVYSNYRRQAEQELANTYKSTGGLIPEYHSGGLPVGINWQSRGTDTVPAMLTPGEYVLRKKAVDSLGLGFLNNLNKFGSNMLQTMNKSTIINNIYNTNNAKISQNIDNKSQYLNGMYGVDKLMRYV